MITNAEAAMFIFVLLAGTPTYQRDSFAYYLNDEDGNPREPEWQIRHAMALLIRLPENERLEVEAAFNRLSDAYALEELSRQLATHQMPRATQ